MRPPRQNPGEFPPSGYFVLQLQLSHVHSSRKRPPKSPTMSMFRAKKLDLGCFVKARTIRDHTKRKVFEQFEPERCADPPPPSAVAPTTGRLRHCDKCKGGIEVISGSTDSRTDKLFGTSSATRRSRRESAPRPSSSSRRCMRTRDRRRSEIDVSWGAKGVVC